MKNIKKFLGVPLLFYTFSAIDLYCVDLGGKEIPEIQEMEINKSKIQFKMIDSSHVITSDDTLLLASYLRLFNYFYVNSLNETIK